MDWSGIWNTVKNFFTSNGWNILKFFSTLLIGIIFIKLIINVTKKLLNKTKIEKIGVQFFIGIMKFILYLILVLSLLKIMGIEISGIVTAFSALLLAIGVALEDNIANFANGIIIVSTKMFSKGDYIIVDGVEGSITDINFLFTTLITPDNRRVTLPNSSIVNKSVTNNGAYKTRRVQITFSVAYESDVELVKKVVTDVMKSNGKVYLDKDIFCRLRTMSASSLDFYSYCWVDKEDYWNVYYYLMENVYNEFKRYGITVPFQQVEVRNRTDDVVMPVIGTSLPPRVDKIRKNKSKFDLEDMNFKDLFKQHKHAKDNHKKGKKDAMDHAIERSIAGREIEKKSKNDKDINSSNDSKEVNENKTNKVNEKDNNSKSEVNEIKKKEEISTSNDDVSKR